jgi:hypothetical protein
LFIIDGQGKIDQTPFTKGEFLMISSEENYHLTGDFKYAKVQIN